jgi:hypothetical protein
MIQPAKLLQNFSMYRVLRDNALVCFPSTDVLSTNVRCGRLVAKSHSHHPAAHKRAQFGTRCRHWQEGSEDCAECDQSIEDFLHTLFAACR